jgi:hypothetical protein
VQPVGGDGQGLDLGIEHGRERGVDRPGGGVEGEDVAPGDRRCRRGGTGHLGELAPGDDRVPDLDDGGDLAVEHVRRPVRRVARHHRRLRHVDRGAGLRHQTDKDGGRQQCQQDSTTHVGQFLSLDPAPGTARL